MYQLSEEEVDLVYERFGGAKLRNRMLEDELVDHICCAIESFMTEHIPFEEACDKAYQAVCPNGLREIEEETFILLTYTKQLSMKRILFVLGFLSTFLLSFGFLFKLMHWPLATGIMLSGFGVLFLTLGVMVIYLLQTMKSMQAALQVRMIAGLFSGLLLTAGSIFKMLHYPGASVMIVSGLMVLNLVFLPLFFYQLYRKSVA